MTALLGINALRRGEQDNCIGCVGPSSCIFPIAREAVHTRPAGSREAVEWFTAYLEEWPGDLRVRWLLNIAYMTLGEYPDKVPPRYLIPVDAVPLEARPGAVRERRDPRRPDRAGARPGRRLHLRRLHRRRPPRPLHDLVRRRPRGLAVRQPRRRHGSRTAPATAGLDDQVYALNVTRADYDNDGRLDVLLLRGAWEKPARMSLLAEQGGRGLRGRDGRQRAGRADLHRVGRLGRLRQRRPARPVRLRRVSAPADPEAGDPSSQRPTPGTAAGSITTEGTARSSTSPPQAGVQNERWAKGSAWGDYDNDGRLDLFVSNMEGPARLYRNQRRRHVRRRRPRAGRRRAAARLHLHVLGLRQRRPARHLRRRLQQQPRRGRGRLPRPAGALRRSRPPLSQPRRPADSAR